MTPKEFLEQLSPFSRVFDLSVDYKYTEYQMLLFAKLYHESELKKLRVGDVSVSVCDNCGEGKPFVCAECYQIESNFRECY